MPLEEVDSEFSYKELLLMPLRGSLLLSTLGLSLLYLLGSATVFGYWLLVLVVFATIRYAQIVVEKTMYGYKEPPPLSPSDFNLFFNSSAAGFYALVVVLLLLGKFLVAPLGNTALFIYVSVLLFALPAMMAATVLENGLLTALNPVRLGQIIHTLGLRYVSVFAVVAFGFISSNVLASVINWPILNVFASLYGLFLLSCAVGRLVYISRVELGLNIRSQQDLRDQQDKQYERTQDHTALQQALQTSRLAPVDAAAQLWRYNDQNNIPLARRLECFEALQKWPDSMTALRFAQPFTKHLTDKGFNENAIEVVRWCVTTEPAFRLAEAATTYHLGTFAANNGQYKLAAYILQDMGTRYPDFQNSTSAMFKVANIAGEKMSHAPLLKKALKQLIALGVSRDDSRIVDLLKILQQLTSTTNNVEAKTSKPD